MRGYQYVKFQKIFVGAFLLSLILSAMWYAVLFAFVGAHLFAQLLIPLLGILSGVGLLSQNLRRPNVSLKLNKFYVVCMAFAWLVMLFIFYIGSETLLIWGRSGRFAFLSTTTIVCWCFFLPVLLWRQTYLVARLNLMSSLRVNLLFWACVAVFVLMLLTIFHFHLTAGSRLHLVL